MAGFTNTKESGLETLIVKWLVEHNGYEEGSNSDYNKEYAIDETRLFRFLKDTQPDQMDKLGVFKSEQKKRQFLTRLQGELAKRGIIDADEKCVILAKKIKELVDDKAQFADWATRDDIKNQLNMELTVLLYKNGYPPEWDEEVFEKVMEQAENFKRYSDKG